MVLRVLKLGLIKYLGLAWLRVIGIILWLCCVVSRWEIGGWRLRSWSGGWLLKRDFFLLFYHYLNYGMKFFTYLNICRLLIYLISIVVYGT